MSENPPTPKPEKRPHRTPSAKTEARLAAVKALGRIERAVHSRTATDVATVRELLKVAQAVEQQIYALRRSDPKSMKLLKRAEAAIHNLKERLGDAKEREHAAKHAAKHAANNLFREAQTRRPRTDAPQRNIAYYRGSDELGNAKNE